MQVEQDHRWLRHYGAVVVVAALVLGAGVGIGYLLFNDSTPAPRRDHTFRLVFQGSEGNAKGNMSVDLNRSRICVTADLPWARAAQIHRDGAGPSSEIDGVAVTLFERPQRFRETMCASAERTELQAIARDPGLYYVDYHKDDAGKRFVWSQLYPIGERTALTTSERFDAVLPSRRALARSLGENYTITKMKVQQPTHQSDPPSKVVAVIAHWEGPGHRRWGLTFEKGPTVDAAASEFKVRARVGNPPESEPDRSFFCASEDSGRNYCTVLFQDIILQVVPLPTKNQGDYYPSVEAVTEVTGDTARVFRTESFPGST